MHASNKDESFEVWTGRKQAQGSRAELLQRWDTLLDWKG